jgi:WD40 repeat protein
MRRPVAGGSPEMVLEEAAGLEWGYMCLLTRGSLCVLHQEEGKQAVFYSPDPVRGGRDRIGTIEAGYPHWGISPNGSRLTLVDQQKCKGRIEMLTLSDRAWREIPVEPGWGDFQDINWAADGKGLFVTSWLPDSIALLYVSLAGKVKPLVRNGHRQWMASPLASPDGKWLAYQAHTWDGNVWMLESF